jgi:hypothetical protein
MDEDEGLFGYELPGDELRRVIGTSAEERLAYFVSKSKESGQVWTIGAGEELIVLADDEDQPFVVAFPHPEFGQEWFTTTDLDDVDLVAVGTEDWTREILPGLQEAEIAILVFPTSENEGMLSSPDDLAKLIQAGS